MSGADPFFDTSVPLYLLSNDFDKRNWASATFNAGVVGPMTVARRIPPMPYRHTFAASPVRRKIRLHAAALGGGKYSSASDSRDDAACPEKSF
jgi:hypothetical protein